MKSSLLVKNILGHLTLFFAPIIISVAVRGRHLTMITNLRGNKLLDLLYRISCVFGEDGQANNCRPLSPFKKTLRL